MAKKKKEDEAVSKKNIDSPTMGKYGPIASACNDDYDEMEYFRMRDRRLAEEKRVKEAAEEQKKNEEAANPESNHDHDHDQDHDHHHDHDHTSEYNFNDEMRHLGNTQNTHKPHPHKHTNTTAVLNRLARATGHLEKVKRMILSETDCSEVLIQLSAVIAALNNTGKVILKDHMDHCIVDAVESGDHSAIDKLSKAIDIFIK